VAAIYLDNAATTRVTPAVAEAMRACLVEDFGNPSSVHGPGRRAAERMAEARVALLGALGGDGEIVFTSGGTEADYLGVLGAARARPGDHVVVTAIEHPAVLGAADETGLAVTRVPVGADGVVDPDAVAAALTPATSVVACMLVQNELGTIQPVVEVVRAVRARRPDVHIHCDAVQALGKIPIDARALGVHSLAVSAHKLHGPKGTGALWLAPGARVRPLVVGGGQEHGRRAGTENVAGIVGFGVAAAAAVERLAAAARIAALRDSLWRHVHAAVPGALLLGEAAPRVPQIATLAFPGLTLSPLAALEAAGVIASAGAACHGSARSHVLDAIGAPPDAAVIRLSFSFETTADEVAAGARAVVAAVRP
jgi:cysteine desulfurase